MRFLKETVALIIFTLAAHAQIPNASFETWPGDCDLTDWAINSICDPQFSVRPITRTATAQSGQYAVRGEVITLFGQAFAPVIQSGVEGQGFPITQAYTTLSGHYQFAPVAGDRLIVNVVLTRGDIETGTPIIGGATNLPAASSYTPFTLALATLTNGVPDRAYISISIIGPVTGNDYHLGSIMHIDNLSFGTGGGSTNTSEPRLTITRTNNNAITVSWPADLTGFNLQQTTNLNPVNWQNTPGLTTTNRSHTLTPTTNIFFRLLKP